MSRRNQYSDDPLWTQDIAAEAVTILRRHGDLDKALAEISGFMGRAVNSASLRAAFARYGLGAPTSLLIGAKKQERLRRADMPPLEMVTGDIERKIAGAERRTVGRTEYLGERLAEAVAKLPPITVKVQPVRMPKPRKGAEPECVWFDLSDLQIGSRVEASVNGGLNEHSHPIFLEKLARWEAQAIALIEERISIGRVTSIMIALVGDVVDGMGIYALQPFEIDLDGYTQLMEGSRALSAAFIRIRKTFPKIPLRMASVSGNHGRVGRYGENPHRCNWDSVMAQFIKLQMEAAGASPVEFHIPDTWYALISLFGQTHMLSHGDAVNSSQGVPFASLKTYLLKHSQLFGQPVHIAHHGHWHAEAMVSTTQGEILINGNFVGTNAFSSRVMVEGGHATQMAYIFNERFGLTAAHKLRLQTRVENRPKLDVRKA